LAESAHGSPGYDAVALGSRFAGLRLGHPLVVVALVESTNDMAWRYARDGGDEGFLALAESQTRGRGRAGHSWFSPPGVGVWASFLLRPKMESPRVALLPLAAGVAMARAAERMGVPAGLKWPNDLVAPDGSGRKLGGVLVESRLEDRGRWTAVVGVGVNVNTVSREFPPALQATATSLAEVGGREISREDFLVALTEHLGEEYGKLEQGEDSRLLHDWRSRAVMFGRPVTVRGGGAEVSGIARDLVDDGSLLIRLDSGAELEVRAGDLEVVWPLGGGSA